MNKIGTAIAITLCCVSLNGFAQEEQEAIVRTEEVSIEVEPCTDGADTSSQHSEDDKGGN